MFAMTSWILTALNVMVCVSSAVVCWRAFSLVVEIRSLRSLQSEIAEIDVCVGTLITTIRRIEGRQTARLGRSTSPDTLAAPLMDKDQLRRYAGIVAGQPVRHDNGRNDVHPAERIHGSRTADGSG